MFNMNKIKTEQQQLSEKSETALSKSLEDYAGWSVEHARIDYGTDGKVLVFEGEKHGGYEFDFQLKSILKGENHVDIKTSDIILWSKKTGPFFIFFWNESENQIYFLDIHEYYGNLSRSDSEKLAQKTIRIKFFEKLDKNSIDDIRKTVQRYCEVANDAIRRHENKDAQIKDFLGQEKIIAMGYSFAGHNITNQILRGAAIMGANFEKSILSNSDMRSISAMGANFTDANLRDCDLRSGSFMGANFENADLRGAKLEGAVFTGAFLSKADFRGASFNELSLWSISKAYDFDKAIYDDGILEKIRPLQKINNYSSGNI